MRWRRVSLGAIVAVVSAARLRRWFPVRVAGDSMMPSVRAGDLLAVRGLRADEPRLGQVVVARQGGREVAKRVVGVPGETDGVGYWLEGDNPERSTDSRTSGAVGREDVVGVVRGCYWPPRRVRRL